MSDFKITAMTPDVLQEKFPDVYKAVESKGYAMGIDEGFKEGHIKGFTEGQAKGAETERQRVKAVEAQMLPGHEALISQLKFDGKTTGEQAAIAVLNAERDKRKTRMQSLEESALKPVPPSNTDSQPMSTANGNDKGFESLVTEYMATHNVTRGRAMIACGNIYPEKHAEFIAETNKNRRVK